MNDSLMNDSRAQTEADAAATVEDIVRRAGTSFYWAMRRLPENKRRAMYGIYAFCREVDDIADGPGRPAAKQKALAAWRDEIGALYEGRPRRLISQALAEPVARYGLRRDDFIEILRGVEMDAQGLPRAPAMARPRSGLSRTASVRRIMVSSNSP